MRVDLQQHGSLAVGDEPLLLARVAPCWVGVDRVAAAREAIADGASALVLDDGMQNPSLAKDYSIAVIDGEAGFGNGLCFPAGPLRAPLQNQAPFVSAEVAVGGGPSPPRAPGAGRPLFRARLEADAIVAAELIGRPVLAFAGIARPEKFFATLEGIGAIVAGRRRFPDHYVYDSRDIAELAAAARRRGLSLVTTEKDYVRLAADQRAGVRALPVTLRFEAPERIAHALAAALADRRISARSRP
jgi:tetraacyldisaccharide 4'-kinase